MAFFIKLSPQPVNNNACRCYADSSIVPSLQLRWASMIIFIHHKW